ncbi:EGF-like domain protein, partial [Cooperia oncophora]
ISDGKIVGEIVNGGETAQVVTDSIYNDGRWHTIYWEADTHGMRLRVDGRTSETNATLILPNAHQWTIGSRTERGSSGFAGVIRSVHLCGEELTLSSIVRKDYDKGVHIGEEGYCRVGLCKNGGVCVDKYDGYTCDCTQTPFGGSDCNKEYSMFVPAGSFLQIPWQNPAHTNNCHQIAIQTSVTNVSLVKSKALFAESTFNMSITPQVFDLMGTINTIRRNWTSSSSQLQFGHSWTKPEKISLSNKLKGVLYFFGFKNFFSDTRQPSTRTPNDEGIHIHAIAHAKHHIISVTSIIGLAVAGLLALLLAILVC